MFLKVTVYPKILEMISKNVRNQNHIKRAYYGNLPIIHSIIASKWEFSKRKLTFSYLNK